jgi:hypothetical protein
MWLSRLAASDWPVQCLALWLLSVPLAANALRRVPISDPPVLVICGVLYCCPVLLSLIDSLVLRCAAWLPSVLSVLPALMLIAFESAVWLSHDARPSVVGLLLS